MTHIVLIWSSFSISALSFCVGSWLWSPSCSIVNVYHHQKVHGHPWALWLHCHFVSKVSSGNVFSILVDTWYICFSFSQVLYTVEKNVGHHKANLNWTFCPSWIMDKCLTWGSSMSHLISLENWTFFTLICWPSFSSQQSSSFGIFGIPHCWMVGLVMVIPCTLQRLVIVTRKLHNSNNMGILFTQISITGKI